MDDPGPSDRDRIDAIHRHAHQALRYYATAFLRERGDDRDLMRVYLDLTGNFMALIEGASLDEASMMERRSEIVERYLEEAKRDPWTPPCSFCGEGPTVAWFEGPSFKTFVDAGEKVRAEEAWLACATCLSLVQAEDRDELVRRGIERWRRRRGGLSPDPMNVDAMVSSGHERFWGPRSA